MFELFDPGEDYRTRRGANLPHWFQPGVTYFVTFRTEDSIPDEVSKRWRMQRINWLSQVGIDPNSPGWQAEFAKLPKSQRREFHTIFSSAYLRSLDKGYGACDLKRPQLSQIVADSLLYFDGDRYHLSDFVVMPNHVHLMVCLLGETELEAQCYSWKKYSATKINQVLGKKGRFWQEECFDHLVRSVNQLERIRSYIGNNPANLNAGDYYLYQR